MRLCAVGLTVTRGRSFALSNVSLSVGPGEALGVFGPSGAGKSTLLAALAGQLRADGALTLDGVDVTREPIERRARRGLGYVPQGASVLFDLTAEQNLATALALSKKQGDPVGLLDEVGLSARRSVAAASLSGGERRRLELARALALQPALLLCDEPFSGLGPRDLGVVERVLARRVAEGLSLVITDHRVREALVLCDRALLLLDGAVAVERPRETFLDAEEVNDRYLADLPPK